MCGMHTINSLNGMGVWRVSGVAMSNTCPKRSASQKQQISRSFLF